MKGVCTLEGCQSRKTLGLELKRTDSLVVSLESHVAMGSSCKCSEQLQLPYLVTGRDDPYGSRGRGYSKKALEQHLTIFLNVLASETSVFALSSGPLSSPFSVATLR